MLDSSETPDCNRRCPTRASDLLNHIHIVRSNTDRDALLKSLFPTTKPSVISFLNAHAFNLAWNDLEFADNLRRSDILLRDGIGISLLMRFLGKDPGHNMNGTDLIPLIVQACAGKRVALCGTVEPYLSRAAAMVRKCGCEIALVIHGFAELEDYLQGIAEANADLVILAMGMPKQETVAFQLIQQQHNPMLIVNGGAILDFWGNRFPRAPSVLRWLQLEWLFRLLNEPRRLWRRYLLDGMAFVMHAVQLRYRLWKRPMP
jgi:exopolysaccharide biosynthesis WecB/TagA/CpsF family protein